MAVITKTQIATILGIDVSLISDFLYTWAKNQFFALTKFYENDTAKEFETLINKNQTVFRLGERNIKSIDAVYFDGTEQTGLTLNSSYYLNAKSGLIKFVSVVAQHLKIEFTVEGYIHTDLGDFLIALLTYKGIALFTPNNIYQVKQIKIGKFFKTFGAVNNKMETFLMDLDREIESIRDMILGDDKGFNFGGVIT